MSTSDENLSDNVASHTLSYLRRMDKRVDNIQATMIQIVDLLSRQATKIDRSDRDHREAFSRIERELHEIKGDALLSENKILDRFSETLELSRRMDGNDARLDEIETRLPQPLS